MQADRNYSRIVYWQDGHPEISDIRMTQRDAEDLLVVSAWVHAEYNWLVSPCLCGRGFNAVRGDIRRSEHAIPETELVDAGLLPTPVTGTLAEVL